MRKKYLRSILQTFEEYVPGEQPQEPGWIKLNTNENPYPPSPRVRKALHEATRGPLNLYPDPLFVKLRNKVSELYKVKKEQVFFGNGSDEVLRVITEAFLEPKEKVVILYPSYPLYKPLADIREGRTVQIQLTNDFDLPNWDKKWQGKLFFIPSPNSPTGGLFSVDKISRVCRLFKGIVVLDEAYVDFSSFTYIPLLKKFKNLIICRTFSKSYSLAGMRIGYALGSLELISCLYLIKDSYNVNQLSQVAALAALEDREYMSSMIRKVVKTKERLVKELIGMNYKVLSSGSNFIFAIPPDQNGKKIYQYLKKNKILVRYWEKPRLSQGVRISIGTDKDVDTLIKTLKSW